MTAIDNVSLAQRVYTVEQVQKGEKPAAEACSISMMQLMSAAGAAVFKHLQQDVKAPAKIAVCCGEGNNGGDGYIIARLAQEAGYQVDVFALSPNKTISSKTDNNAERARLAWRDSGGQEKAVNDCEPQRYDIVVDALFGVGLNRALEGAAAALVQTLNEASAKVLAVDVPSGLNADTGSVPGVAVHACKTVCLVAHKRGLLTGKAKNHVGQLVLEDLGIGDAFAKQNKATYVRVTTEHIQNWLPRRQPCEHKGDNGHVLIVGGQPGMSGAVVLAMQAALRCGAGKVSVACHPEVQAMVAAAQPEAMVRAVSSQKDLQAMMEQANVIALGPGLGQSDWSREAFSWVADHCINTNKAWVIDADGLNILAAHEQKERLGLRVILTPNPGEAARLLNIDSNKVESDRFSALNALRDNYEAQILLKGAGSLVTSDAGQFILDAGSPAMASGGMGDLLTGLVSGLVAQGMPETEAVVAAGIWHGRAGELAGNEGERGTLASDLLPYIRQLVNGKIT